MSAGRVFGIIGWPVAHSISPAIHNAAFRELGLDAHYVRFPVAPGALPKALAGARALGVEGLNVTMPHKVEAAGLVDALEGDAATLGAVNTIARRGEALVGHNTDADGFGRFVTEDASIEVAGTTALVLGAGGAARACAWALLRLGADRVVIAARSRERADDLARAIGSGIEVIAFSAAGEGAASANVVVNATPLGSGGEPAPVEPRAGQAVIDLAYRPTRLVEEARAAGAKAHDGLGMLVRQAALAIEIWTGSAAPIAAMDAAARAAVGRRD